MNKNLIIAFIALLFAGCVLGQGSYWEDLPSPPVQMKWVKQPSNPDTLYADSGSLPYLSTDGGMSWQKVQITPPAGVNTPVNYVSIGNKGTYFAYTGETSSESVYKSVDKGATWQVLRAKVGYFHQVVETSTGKLLEYDFSGHTKINLSIDGGQSWTELWSKIEGSQKYIQLFEYPNQQLVMWRRASSDTSFYSNDTGANWTTFTPPSGNNFDGVTASLAGTLFVYGHIGYYFQSTDRGKTWEKVQLNTKNIQLTNITSMLALPSGRILCSGPSAKTIYYSDDNGLSWQAQSSNRFINLETVLPNGDLFGTGNILYRSTDGGQNWEPANIGTPLSRAYNLNITHSNIQFFRAWGTGVSYGAWRLENGDLEELHPNTELITTGEEQLLLSYYKVDDYKGVLWSNDWGRTLTDVNLPPVSNYIEFVGISPGDSIWFVGIDHYLYRSTNQGLTWQNTGKHYIKQMVFHPSGRYFAVSNTSDGKYFTSDDFGKSWQLRTNLLPSFRASSISIGPSNTLYLISGNDAILARSTDMGASWQYSSLPYAYGYNQGNSTLQENSAGHFLANIIGQFVLSTNQGVSWQSIPKNPNSSSTTMFLLGPDQHIYITNHSGLARTVSPTTQGAYLRGHVRKDADADCSTPDAQEPISQWVVEAKGAQEYFTNTDSAGRYFLFLDTGAYLVSPRIAQELWWENCDGPQNIVLDSLLTTDTADFAIAALSECPLITVDLTIPQLRRCFDNTVYVSYCNQGSEPADSAWVDIELDPYLSLVSSAQPNTPLGNNTFRFSIGNLTPGQCGNFTLAVHVDCDSTVPGQTHCITAHGYPDTLCVPVPAWSGAEIQASITCQDTVVHFELQNVGPAPSQLLNYIIIEDDVVLMSGQEDYNPAELLTFDLPANGHTWRLESEQEPGHPFATPNHIALAFAEGCAGFESLGFINQFPVDEFTPSWDRDCLENIGSFDPNDKQGFPTGYSAEHRIRPGQELEYLIRFQNTGTDTAFTVIIRDTLSPWLDPASVRPGASSHDYTWNLSGQGVLAFTFNNILLPDSNANEAASHGFISFRIEQHPDVPLEAVIYNEANIYFDFNAPVITNETWHTVGELKTVGLSAVPKPIVSSEISVNPQPASSFAVFQRTDGKAFRNHRLYLIDALGHTLRELELNGKQCRFESEGLNAGLYFFQIKTAEGRHFGAGKLIFKP